MCHVSRHVSRVTCHHFFIFFFGQSGEVYWWRVCYQRGLPRLVLVKTRPRPKTKLPKLVEIDPDTYPNLLFGDMS